MGRGIKINNTLFIPAKKIPRQSKTLMRCLENVTVVLLITISNKKLWKDLWEMCSSWTTNNILLEYEGGQWSPKTGNFCATTRWFLLQWADFTTLVLYYLQCQHSLVLSIQYLWPSLLSLTTGPDATILWSCLDDVTQYCLNQRQDHEQYQLPSSQLVPVHWH